MGTLSIRSAAIALTLALACFTGCAPEEDGSGVPVRPKTPTPSPTAAPQKNASAVTGGISTAGGLSSPTPQPEPSSLPPWTPPPPPSIHPIIVEPTATASLPGTDPTPDLGTGESVPTLP